MKRITILGISLLVAVSSYAEVVVLVDGSELEVENYEIQDSVLVFTTSDGSVRSLALSMVNVEATRRGKSRAGTTSLGKTTRSPVPATASKPMPRQSAIPPLAEIAAKVRSDRLREAPVPQADKRSPKVEPGPAPSLAALAAESPPESQPQASPPPAATRRVTPAPLSSPGTLQITARFDDRRSPDMRNGQNHVARRDKLDTVGLESLVVEMLDVVSASLIQAERYVPAEGPDTRGLVRSAFERAFERDRILEATQLAFARAEARRQSGAFGWNTPLNQQMAELEIAARGPEALRGLREYAAGLERAMPPAARLERLQRLAKVRGDGSASIERRIDLLRAILEALGQLTSQQERLSDEQLNQILDTVRNSLRTSMKNHSLVSLLFTYRSATDAELDQYIAFWESEEGRWLNQITEQALSAGMEHGLATARESLAQAMKTTTD